MHGVLDKRELAVQSPPPVAMSAMPLAWPWSAMALLWWHMVRRWEPHTLTHVQ